MPRVVQTTGSHPSTNRAQRCFTSVMVRELVFPSWLAAAPNTTFYSTAKNILCAVTGFFLPKTNQLCLGSGCKLGPFILTELNLWVSRMRKEKKSWALCFRIRNLAPKRHSNCIAAGFISLQLSLLLLISTFSKRQFPKSYSANVRTYKHMTTRSFFTAYILFILHFYSAVI